MTVEEIFGLLEREIAPVKLSDDFCAKYKMYDNSGIIINCGADVTGALFTLDFSLSAAERAAECGYNLIVTHHPAIYGGISSFDVTSNAQARAIALCLKKGISVISMHLNFDAAPKGIDYYLMEGLGGKRAEIACEIDGGGYGRVYPVDNITLSKFVQGVRDRFLTERVITYGSAERKVKKVASFCGAGCDDHNIEFAKINGADVFVSSDLKHHQIAELTACGIAVVQITHYCAESYGFNKIYENIKDRLNTPSSFYCDAELL